MARTTLKQFLEKRLGKSFRSIILDNIPLGTGRYESARILEALCEKHQGPEDEHINVLHSTLWYTVKTAIENGELCEVPGDPKTKPLFYFNHGKHRHVTVRKIEPISTEIECHWTCSECNREWETTKTVESLDMMTVRSQCCPSCQKRGVNTFGKIILRFEHEGVQATKAVISIEGKPRESFVDETMNPCQSPFSKELVSSG